MTFSSKKTTAVVFMVLSVFVAVFWFCTCAVAGDDLTIDADQQLAFGDHLFESGQFLRAAEEYQRFIFFFPHSTDLRTVIYKAGVAFFKAGELKSAIQQFNRLTADNMLDSEALRAHFMAVEVFIKSGSPTQATVALHNLIALSDSTEIKDKALFRLGWIYIDQGDWQQAKKTFSRISETDKYPLKKLTAALDRTDMIPQKKPALAGTLSIIPGAGQLYCERYQDALIAFLLNTGLIWASIDAYNNDQYALGGLLTFIGVGFYAGNIYGAVSDAHKYNQRQRQRFKEALHWQMSLGIEALKQPDIAWDQRSPNAVVARISIAF